MSDGNSLGKILFFNTMLTPTMIEIGYWLGLLAIALATIAAFFEGEIGAGLAIIFIGTIMWRVWCEVFIVLFKINENIQKIADKA